MKIESGPNTPALNFVYLETVRSKFSTSENENVNSFRHKKNVERRNEKNDRGSYNQPQIALQSCPSSKVDIPVSPAVRYNPAPIYPLSAREKGLEGIIKLIVEVVEDGMTEDVSIKVLSGYEILDNAALQSVKQWIFTPAYSINKPISTNLEVPIRFQLSDI